MTTDNLRAEKKSDTHAEIMLYVHFPFCVKKCDYCDFLSFRYDNELVKAYLEALGSEIRSRTDSAYGRSVSSVFFGGGTPSLMTGEEIKSLMELIRENYKLADDCEITLEANPGTLSEDKLKMLKEAGINRLSIGLQSANDESLKKLGRIHDLETFEAMYNSARKAGLSNINIDIMSALPGETAEAYGRTLEKVLKYKPEHISAYSLIIEEGTPFYERYEGGKGLPDEDTERQMYHLTKDLLSAAGYERYEISNYALAGCECRHNTGYWTGRPYIGLGLGASGYMESAGADGKGYIRTRNVSGLKEYIKDPLQYEESLVLTDEMRMEEYMFLGLRMMQGIAESGFYDTFGTCIDDVYGNIIKRHINSGLLEKAQGRIRLTDRGIDVSNYVLADFLMDK
ncbi:MAG: oxygen-independent coproporphyrinogen III oxidase [Lachnospiraceae bacterium]|nr:oxygen-independent coproporphyrinogen III oxidase [Lachnospiraceae bacterium]